MILNRIPKFFWDKQYPWVCIRWTYRYLHRTYKYQFSWSAIDLGTHRWKHSGVILKTFLIITWIIRKGIPVIRKVAKWAQHRWHKLHLKVYLIAFLLPTFFFGPSRRCLAANTQDSKQTNSASSKMTKWYQKELFCSKYFIQIICQVSEDQVHIFETGFYIYITM